MGVVRASDQRPPRIHFRLARSCHALPGTDPVPASSVVCVGFGGCNLPTADACAFSDRPAANPSWRWRSARQFVVYALVLSQDLGPGGLGSTPSAGHGAGPAR
jgi:hypothetical protein